MTRSAVSRRPLRGHCLAPGRPVERPADAAVTVGRYVRLFPDLPALEVDRDLLHALGVAGAPCDRGETPGRPAKTAAGWPFFGQLIAHDVTADRSPLDHTAAEGVGNFRTPRLNLECLYGAGPVGAPYLYDRDDPAKLLLGAGGWDAPRNAQGTALIGDPRNDVHLFVNQLHVALIRAHNAVVDHLRASGAAEAGVFDEARRTLLWHYQWVVLNEFATSLAGEALMAELLDTPMAARLVREPAISYEFADAAFRYGHSQVRQRYRINDRSGELAMFPDLIGFRPVPRERAIDWRLLFDMPGAAPAQRAERIDGRMPAALIALPHDVTGDVDDPSYRSLASRDLQRGLATALPSGEAVARALGVRVLTPEEVGLPGWRGETPLAFYIEREADMLGEGDRLGPVGGRIVAGTLLAIADGDPTSFRAISPGWTPTLPAASGRAADFGLADLLTLSDRLQR